MNNNDITKDMDFKNTNYLSLTRGNLVMSSMYFKGKYHTEMKSVIFKIDEKKISGNF